MLKDIVNVTVIPPHNLRIHFEDGVFGEIDIGKITKFEGIFAPLRDEIAFSDVTVNHELGTIQWPNGADLDPDVLYALLGGQEVKVAA